MDGGRLIDNSVLEAEIGALFNQAQGSVALAHSTADPRVNAILQGVVGVFEHYFPERIHGYYLVGSYANGTAVAASDIDIHPVFKGEFGPEEAEQVYRIRDICNGLTYVELNVDPWPDSFAGVVYGALFQLVALPVYGADIRARFPLPSLEAYARQLVGVGGLLKVRQRATLRYPLAYPDPAGEFYGYDGRGAADFDGVQEQGTKGLIGAAYSIVLGRLALTAPQYIVGKAEAFHLYRQCVKDEWSDFIAQVWQRCRQDWHYKIPTRDSDRQILRRLCRDMLDLENFYLRLYRGFMLEELAAQVADWPYGDSDYTIYSLGRLATVLYPGDAAVALALQPFLQAADLSWRQAAQSATDSLGKVQTS
ncbi:MAG: hypothetical protein GKR89_06855 [Candidatus Latescibacteria bacterium]|nr:hypothetical protein [Candidatus Latescibacterota bacterium]